MPAKVLRAGPQYGCNAIMNGNDPCPENDDVVISGVSGRFPESNSIAEFGENLFNGVDMVTDDDRRWPTGKYNVASYDETSGFTTHSALEREEKSTTRVRFRSLRSAVANGKAKTSGDVRRQLLRSTCQTGRSHGPAVEIAFRVYVRVYRGRW